MEWVAKEINIDKYDYISKKMNISELTAKLLVSRGINTPELARMFLYPDYNSELHNPSNLKDIEIVLQRITKAKNTNQKVLVHGDYDTDGVYTIYVFLKILKDVLKMDVEWYAPNRFTDGYGVNAKNVEKFSKYDLVITGDTGIKAYSAISQLTDLGVDVIVTDHHEPLILEDTEENRALIPENVTVINQDNRFMVLPKCLAVVNPKRFDCSYESKDLCGAAVAFKVMQALLEYLHYDKRQLNFLIDGVATASIADLVPLMDTENKTFEVRNLVKLGLGIMNMKPKAWTRSILIEKLEEKLNKNPRAKNEIPVVNSGHLGFTYGPILNAVGRLYDPSDAVNYVLTDNEVKSREGAKNLISINKERQTLTAEISTSVMEALKKLPKEHMDYAIVVTSEDLHQGITGLVASAVLEDYYRTCIAFAPVVIDGESYLKGSARSIEGINIYDALTTVEKKYGHYEYGGHEAAGGMTIKANRLEEFRSFLREAVKEQVDAIKGGNVFEPKKHYDLELNLTDATHQVVNEIKLLEPFGMGNTEPVFYASGLVIEKLNPIGDGGNFAKILFSQGGTWIEAVMFNKAKKVIDEHLERSTMNPFESIKCDILFSLDINDFNNKVQLFIKELKFQ